MKKMLKKEKGITLIALIITIIVLIILAAISIAVLTGEDGLITKAKQGAQNYQNAAIEEQQALNSIYAQTGAQLAVGSTNNGGTSVNQGGATGGGLTKEEHDVLMSLGSFQPNMYDINPEKLTDKWIYGLYCGGGSGAQKEFTSIPVSGYKKFALYSHGSSTGYKFTISYYDTHGNKVTDDTTINMQPTSWTEYLDIPDGTALLYVTGLWWESNKLYGSYSLLTANSPYNPDNQ